MEHCNHVRDTGTELNKNIEEYAYLHQIEGNASNDWLEILCQKLSHNDNIDINLWKKCEDDDKIRLFFLPQ